MQVRIFLSSQVYVRYGKEGWFMASGKGAARQKKSEHAQAALDFLTEYGWAIVLIVIIAAVLFAFGIFDPAGMSGNRASGFIDVAANGWYLAPDGTFSIKLQNQAGRPIRIDEVEVTYGNQTVNISGSEARIENGQDSAVLYSPPGIFGRQKGGSYTLRVHVRYTDLNANFPYTTKGTLIGRSWQWYEGYDGGESNLSNQANQSNQTNATNLTQWEIASCGTIGAPGEYELVDDIISEGGTCIHIAAPNVTLTCAGYTITGANAQGSVGILATAGDAEISDCGIYGFETGIWLNGAAGSLLYNDEVGSSTSNGILSSSDSVEMNNVRVFADAGNAISIYSASGNSVTECTAENTGSATDGVVASYSPQTEVASCDIDGFPGAGIHYLYSQNGQIYGNVVNARIDGGIALQFNGGSSNNNAYDNAFYGQTSYAAVNYGSSSVNNTLEGNDILGTGPSAGVYVINGAGGGIYRHNVISSESGIAFWSNQYSGGGEGTVGNYFEDNTFSSPTVEVQMSADSGNSIFVHNYFTETAGLYVQDYSGENFWDASVEGVTKGNYWPNVIDGTVLIYDSNADGWGDTGPGYPYGANTSQGKFVGGGADNAPYTTQTNQTNQTNATLTVYKVVINNNGGNRTVSDFQLLVQGNNVTYNVTSGAVNTLVPGTYLVSETNASGYNANFSGACDANGSVTLLPSYNNICTITNDDIPSNQTQLSSCYQETATSPTACGGVGTGAYAYAATWTGGGLAVTDANWATSDSGASGNNGRVHMNYTKPPGATSASVWQVKDGLGTANVTIPQSCWDYSNTTLIFWVRSDGYNPYVSWTCYDGAMHDYGAQGNSWTILRFNWGTPATFEEGMWWNIQSG